MDTTDNWLSSSGQHRRQNSGFLENPRIVLKVIMLMMKLIRWRLLAEVGSYWIGVVNTAEHGGSLYPQLSDLNRFDSC